MPLFCVGFLLKSIGLWPGEPSLSLRQELRKGLPRATLAPGVRQVIHEAMFGGKNMSKRLDGQLPFAEMKSFFVCCLFLSFPGVGF